MEQYHDNHDDEFGGGGVEVCRQSLAIVKNRAAAAAAEGAKNQEKVFDPPVESFLYGVGKNARAPDGARRSPQHFHCGDDGRRTTTTPKAPSPAPAFQYQPAVANFPDFLLGPLALPPPRQWGRRRRRRRRTRA